MPILTGATLLERARRHSDDTVTPYFISDEEMYTYITDAERALAVAGKLLRNVSELEVTISDRWIRLPSTPEIIELRTAILIDSSGNRYPLKINGTMDSLPTVGIDDDYGFLRNSSNLTPGRPKVMILGKKTDYAELSPVANGAYTVEISTIVYPTNSIEGAYDEPTIGERHHQAIAIGAALFALEGSEHEHLAPKIQSLSTAWERALSRAAEENGRITRDASTVQFTNDMW
jgi:hypothetical protein